MSSVNLSRKALHLLIKRGVACCYGNYFAYKIDGFTRNQEYKEHNPEDKHDPTSLELYCDANPEADECRVYDD